mgnify:CR=1 FL=1
MEQAEVEDIPDIADIHLAHARIRARVRVTPVINDSGLDEALGCHLYCKCENLQRTGAFKFRGASNAIARLREDGRDGDVATHSSGNHGAALALAARLDGRTAHVVMPENSSRLKIAAVRGYGGQIHFCAPSNEARAAKLQELVAAGMIPIHPYDNADIIAGQGTAALELQQTVPALEQVITPIGGGGLISGKRLFQFFETLLPDQRRPFSLRRSNPVGALKVFASYRGVVPLAAGLAALWLTFHGRTSTAATLFAGSAAALRLEARAGAEVGWGAWLEAAPGLTLWASVPQAWAVGVAPPLDRPLEIGARYGPAAPDGAGGPTLWLARSAPSRGGSPDHDAGVSLAAGPLLVWCSARDRPLRGGVGVTAAARGLRLAAGVESHPDLGETVRVTLGLGGAP